VRHILSSVRISVLAKGNHLQKYSVLLRSRLPVLAAVAAILVILSLGTHRRGSLGAAWGKLQDDPLTPLFADTRTITHSIDCLLSGQDPYFVRTFDPWHRLYNYPPIWLDARYLGVTSHSSNFIGAMMAFATASTLLLLFKARSWLSAIIIFFAVISRSVLFAVERGNTDQVIFFLLVFGLFLIDRQESRLKPFFKGLLVVLLTVLKIYPVAAVAIFIRHRRGILMAVLTGTLSIAALVLTAGRRLPVLLGNTPRDSLLSFGAYPFFLVVGDHTLRRTLAIIQSHNSAVQIGAIFLGALAMLVGMACGDRLNRFLPPLDSDRARGCIAIAGLAIFCFAFVSGASYDYRLIFLLGALAYLVDDMNQGVSLNSLPAAVLIVLLLWKPSYLSSLGELSDGLVFIMASAWLGNSLLSRTKNEDTLSLGPEVLKSI
jgi:Glycosyltransferase family 87